MAETFGATVRRLREAKGATVKQLAECLDWRHQTVSEMELDRKTVTDPVLIEKIAEFLDADSIKLMRLAEAGVKSVKFDLSDMTPKRKELILFLHQYYDTVTEADARTFLKFLKYN